MQEYRKYNLDQYKVLSKDKSYLKFDDYKDKKIQGYYAISQDWIVQWKNYVEGKCQMPPGVIDNSKLIQKIT